MLRRIDALGEQGQKKTPVVGGHGQPAEQVVGQGGDMDFVAGMDEALGLQLAQDEGDDRILLRPRKRRLGRPGSAAAAAVKRAKSVSSTAAPRL